MPSAVSHALLVAAICVVYFGLMIALGTYMAFQVRQHGRAGSGDDDAEPALPRGARWPASAPAAASR